MSDEDKHYEERSAPAATISSKPIRPKYLIATVTNRVGARAMRQRAAQVLPGAIRRHWPALRAAMLERLEQALMQPDVAQRDGGLLFIGIENVPALRQRMGLTTVEELLEDAAQFIVGRWARHDGLAVGDACFLCSMPRPIRCSCRPTPTSCAMRSASAFDTPKEPVTLEGRSVPPTCAIPSPTPPRCSTMPNTRPAAMASA